MDTSTEPLLTSQEEFDKLEAQLCQDAKMERHQVDRELIGRRLGLKVRKPSDVEQHDGKDIVVSDHLGLTYDTSLYASKKCNTCFGRGLIYLVHPIPEDVARKHIEKNPANEALLFRSKNGGWSERSSEKCPCSGRMYRKKHYLFADALVRAKLAVVIGKKHDHGELHDIIELL